MGTVGTRDRDLHRRVSEGSATAARDRDPAPGRRLLIARIAGRLLAAGVGVWRACCRRRVWNDPRAPLRVAGRSYVIALRHAHQLAALLASDEPRLAAMVSRSRDGELLVASLRRRGIEPVRGSTRTRARDKGGRAALAGLEARLRAGVPAVLTVDGPRGPRGRVRGGVAALARRSGAPVLPLGVFASRRRVLSRTWDRLQLPWPGATLLLAFGDPIEPDSVAGPAELRAAVGRALDRLERRFDPGEARAAGVAQEVSTSAAREGLTRVSTRRE